MKKMLLLTIFIVALAFISCQGNHAPTIEEIIANPATLGPGESTTLFVDAYDEDGDDITITWHCLHGSFSSTTGQTVIWTAPSDTGDYAINVVVEDEAGLTTMEYIIIEVHFASLEKPSVSYEVLDDGSTLKLFWAAIANADGYYIYADGNRIYSTTGNQYDATTAAAIYEVSAYAGATESESDTIDCTPIVTTNITLWGNSDPSPDHPSGLGFMSDGIAITYSIGEQTNWSYIDYYLKDDIFDPIRIVSPNYSVPPLNNENNTSLNSGLTNFNELEIADAPNASYISTNSLYEYHVYSLWMDQNNNGWDNTVDHFGKVRVESIIGYNAPYTVEITVAYQLIPGLRWLVTQ